MLRHPDYTRARIAATAGRLRDQIYPDVRAVGLAPDQPARRPDRLGRGARAHLSRGRAGRAARPALEHVLVRRPRDRPAGLGWPEGRPAVGDAQRGDPVDRRTQRAGSQLRVSRPATGRDAARTRSRRGGARVPGRGRLQREVRDARSALRLDRAGRARPLRHRVVRRAGVGPLLRLRRPAAARGRARSRPRPVARGSAARAAEPLLQRLATGGSRDLGRGARRADTALRAAERRPQPRGRRDRTRAHRHRLALADRGDVPQVRPHVQLADRLHGRLSRVPVRVLAGAAVRVDQAAQPRPVRADQAARRARAVHPGGRHLGRAGLQHPLRRVARAPVPARAVVLRARVRQALPRVLEPGRLRLQRAAAADHARSGHRAVPHPEALVEPFNRPAYHTFLWQGIDGSARADPLPAGRHLQRASPRSRRSAGRARDYKEHDRSRTSFLLFGYGDGGGGPTSARCSRCCAASATSRACRARPSVRARSSSRRSKARRTDWPVLVGELYFEYHRGTYTSQAAVKRANRTCEILLHDVELLAALAHWRGAQPYPRDEITRLWEMLCCNQFHDIIPGSSITEVYEDAARDYAEIERAASRSASRRSPRSRTASADLAPAQHRSASRDAGSSCSPAGDASLVATPRPGNAVASRSRTRPSR